MKKTLRLLSGFLFLVILSAPAQAFEPIVTEWTLIDQTRIPEFDPEHPDYFACPKMVRVVDVGSSVTFENITPDPKGASNELLDLNAINQGRVCRPIQVNGGIFANGRLCETATREEAPDGPRLMLRVCKTAMPVRCSGTDYMWRYKLTASRMVAILDVPEGRASFKTGVCKYARLRDQR